MYCTPLSKKVTVPDSYIRWGSSSDHNTDENIQNQDEIEEDEDLEDELEDEEEMEEIIEVWGSSFLLLLQSESLDSQIF